MDSGEFNTPPDSYSTDQLFNVAEANNTQHANVRNLSSIQQQQQQQPFVFGSDHSGDGSEGVTSGGINGEPEKKRRGRPRIRKLLHGGDVAVGGGGNLKKQMVALGAPAPHIVMVEEGEDVTSKIVEFCEEGARTVCILSAVGKIRSVTLQQSPVLGGANTYEGLFDIITLSGSFVHSKRDDTIKASGLSVVLAGVDGRVLGGAVGGPLVAASPIQVVVGSFLKDTKKPKTSSESSESVGSCDMAPLRYPKFG